ncbi:hypothetical protein [Altererythrobacter sp. Root672]|uniref:hypothetical protein n=1 Tax=Altererythrobacter sp. Root672 TaxID=1736584 RepID=UPI000A415914|nr:hypothetical protein [Altererythrobacter sp. Root672]
MTALLAQRLIAVPFLVLGAWCLLFPGMVERLGVRPEFYHGDTTTALLIGCFGAQAVLSGLFAAFSRFTRTTFLVYGIALLPFFWFNYWFVFVVPVFNQWMALDFVSNAAMLALCVVGYRASSGGFRAVDPLGDH